MCMCVGVCALTECVTMCVTHTHTVFSQVSACIHVADASMYAVHVEFWESQDCKSKLNQGHRGRSRGRGDICNPSIYY